MTLAAGIDLGTGAVKTVLFDVSDAETRWLARRSSRIRRRDPMVLAKEDYDSMLAELDLDHGLIDYVATTGDGENIPFRTGHFYSMTTHARGAIYLQPGINAVIDAGALHGRAISTDERGKVLTYKMTSQCASGSGQFLENIARYLGVALEEVGAISKTADNPETVSSICAVLAETDVINMISRGITTANILKGIHVAMASRLVKLLKSIKAREGSVLVTGGLAVDEGLIEAMEEQVIEQKLKVEVLSHPESIYAGAIGAALWGAFRHEKLLQAQHGVPSADMRAYDEGRPVLAVDLGQEEVMCPITTVAEPKSAACPAEQLQKPDNQEQST
jgi:benzoyl-CoA reductase subunit D